jgi:hypothetical protein
MKIKIPFTRKMFVIEVVDTLEQSVLNILNNRYHNSVNGFMTLSRIEAIKFYRSNTGSGLVDAKNYVDSLVEKYNLEINICIPPE